LGLTARFLLGFGVGRVYLGLWKTICIPNKQGIQVLGNVVIILFRPNPTKSDKPWI